MRAWWGAALLALTLATPAWGQDSGGRPSSFALRASEDEPDPTPEAQPESEAAQPRPRIFERLGVTGAVRAGYWSSTRNLDAEEPLGAGMLWLKTTRRLSGTVSFLAEGWTALRGPLEHGEAAGELREAYIDLRFGRLDV